MVLHSKKLESPPPKDALCFVPNLVLIGLMVLDKIMKSFQYNYTISLLAPVKKSVILRLNKYSMMFCVFG